MSIEVRLPELGGSVSNAKLSVWLKNVGDAVKRGEPVAEVETDKTSVEIEAPGDGVLERIVVAAGHENVAIGDLLAVIDATGRGDTRSPEPPARHDGPQLVPKPEASQPRPETAAAAMPRVTPRQRPRNPPTTARSRPHRWRARWPSWPACRSRAFAAPVLAER